MRCAIALALVALSCRFPTASDEAEIITSLRFSPSAFDSFKHNTELRYSLKNPVRITVMIVHRDSTGVESLVQTLGSNMLESAGAHAHAWLGDTMRGEFAPAGRYLGRLELGTQRFETEVIVYH